MRAKRCAHVGQAAGTSQVAPNSLVWERTAERSNHPMCRNIKTLFNFEPPASEEEVRAAALQFVRKLSGFTKPSRANEQPFEDAVERVTAVADELLAALVTNAPAKDRVAETEKARERAAKRFGKSA
jgi:hypothetical protein